MKTPILSRKITLGAVFFVLSIAAFGGVRVVGNPAGYIENQIVYSWEGFQATIEYCLVKACFESEDEKKFLQFVVKNQRGSGIQKTSLEFHRENERSDLRSRISLSRWGENKKTSVDFNVDELYRVFREPLYFGLKEAYRLILKAWLEFGTAQHGIKSDDLADRLFELSVGSEVTVDTAAFGLKRIYFKVIGSNLHRLLASDDEGLFDLNTTIESKVKCSQGNAEITWIHWISVSGYDPQGLLALDSQMQYRCQNNRYLANVYLLFPVKRLSDTPHEEPELVLDRKNMRLTLRNLVSQ